MTAGTLYLVSTPIGNLKDITLRALETLKSVDLVLAEDTRHTRKLMSHYDIHTRLDSYHDHTDEAKRRKLVNLLKEGKSFALVSDSGTPLVSDPGYRLVRAAVAENISVCPIPGPTALIAALSVSSLATDRFCFEGFLPHPSNARRRRLEVLKNEERTILFYESPHRLLVMLKDLSEILGNRSIVVCRELTKQFEEVFRGRVSEAVEHFGRGVKGEIVVCVEGARI